MRVTDRIRGLVPPNVNELPELFRPTDAKWAARLTAAGTLRRVARGLYTTNLDEPLPQLVRRRWLDAVRLTAPGAVVVDRSAIRAAPEPDGTLFLDTGPRVARPRPVRLPGLQLYPRSGPGPIAGDMPLGSDLWIASEGRIALDNLLPSRARTTVRRTLTRAELEDWLDRRAQRGGPERLGELRDQARAISEQLAATERFADLNRLIGHFLGTSDHPSAGPIARARRAGLAIDRERLALFEVLRAELASDVMPRRHAPADPLRLAAFHEAYFSNWIEGTEFELSEAHSIVFDGVLPTDRPEDGHDVAGTFEAITTEPTRSQEPQSADDLEDYLQGAHRLVMRGRPQQRPGEYKQRPNRAGNTLFVHPDDVRGTLREGFEVLTTLQPGFPRAVFAMFLAAEVHPFGDGNGRVARLLMNAYLTANGEVRIMVPLVFRNEYMTALRAMSANANPRPLVRVLDRAQRWVSRVDWSDSRTVTAALLRSNALVTPDEAERLNLLLRDP